MSSTRKSLATAVAIKNHWYKWLKENNRVKSLLIIDVSERVATEQFSQTFDNGVKNRTQLDDYNQVFDWQTSSFYQATNQSSSVIS